MKKSAVLPALLVAFAAMIITGCARPVAPEYRGLTHLRVDNPGLASSAISADLEYFNPNAYSMKIKSGEMDVYINDRYIGKTILDTMTVIPASENFSIPVSMKVDMKQIFSNALDLVLNKEVNIKLAGSAKLSKGALSFRVPISYEGRQKIDIHL